MSSTSSDPEGIFVINVFTVRPENQQALIDCIRGGGAPAELPGLRSMRLLRSLDGTKVINHMHWDSRAAFMHTTANEPEIAATRERVVELIESADAGLYEVVPIGP